MPTPIPIGEERGDGVIDRVLGPRTSQRSTKTYIPNGSVGFRLAVVENFAARLRQVFTALHHHKFPDDVLTAEQLGQRYRCIHAYESFHLTQTEHLASLKGFSLKVSMGRNPDDAPPHPSTAGTPTPGAVTTPAPASGMQMK